MILIRVKKYLNFYIKIWQVVWWKKFLDWHQLLCQKNSSLCQRKQFMCSSCFIYLKLSLLPQYLCLTDIDMYLKNAQSVNFVNIIMNLFNTIYDIHSAYDIVVNRFLTYWGHEILVSKISIDIVICVWKCLIPSVFVSYA